MHLGFGRILGYEVDPKDSASNVNLEAVLGPSIESLSKKSSLNSTFFVLWPYFEYNSSINESLSMERNSQNQIDTHISIAPNSRTQSLMQSTSNRIYKGIINFFGRFDP